MEGRYHPEMRWTIPAKNVISLCWVGDDLVDAVAGGKVYHLDGSARETRVYWTYRFDAGAALDGRLVFWERFGTKGAVALEGRIVREINRSFYCADKYEYPLTLFHLPNGHAAIAHCPDGYNRIEIDDLATGERLTRSEDRNPDDFFHSRLAVSPGGRYLLSGGWIWHPACDVLVFDLHEALQDARALDAGEGIAGIEREIDDAVWLDERRLVLALSNDWYDEPEDKSFGLALYDVVDKRRVTSIRLDTAPGLLMACGTEHVVSFHGHPKVFDLATGQIVESWPEIATGDVRGPLSSSAIRFPLALDPARRRFAVADAEAITVIQLDWP
jgi:hypothetical protein